MADVTENQGLSVEAVLDRVLAAVPEPLPEETVPLARALGRVLVRPVRSPIDLPRWDNSAMDGYAVRAADVAAATPDAPVRLRVLGESRAGRAPDVAVAPGTAVRIATGAPLPEGADAVVPVEQTRGGRFAPDEPVPESCEVLAPVDPGASVRRRGEDVTTGDAVLAAGTRLGPAHIALAAAVGAYSVPVHRVPVVAILATGDEVAPAGTTLGPAQIPDSNGPTLLALCEERGFAALDLGIARDSLERTIETLTSVLADVDAIVVTGGVSAGPYDLVRPAFEAIGTVDLWRVAVQPGRPFAFGVSRPRPGGRSVLLFGLPGNPVSTFVTFELFVRPALVRLAGGVETSLPRDRAVLSWDVRKRPGRRQYLRAAAVRDERGDVTRDGRGRVQLVEAGGQGSHVLSALAAADALAIIPEEAESIDRGSEVEMLWLRR